MESLNVLLGAFTAVESAHGFSAFCPSVFTIRQLANQTEEGKAAIREGYIPASIFAILLGLIVSKLTKSWLPLLFSLGTIAFMVAAYEWALSQPVTQPAPS